MESEAPSEYVAECFWPGVDAAAVRALDERAAETAAGLTRAGTPVRYMGSLFMREDEVVLCLFEGSEASVRKAAELARVPFERILEAALVLAAYRHRLKEAPPCASIAPTASLSQPSPSP